MRIMHFAGGGDIGGAKTHILSLGKELTRDNQFQLVSFRRGVFADAAIALGLDVTVIDKVWNLYALLKLAIAAVDEFQPEIIHCHGAKANMMGIMVKIIRHIPVCTTVHSEPKGDYMGEPFKHLTYGSINLLALKNMDYYMAVAGGMERSLIGRGIDPQKIYVIHNGLDFSRSSSRFDAKSADEEIVVGIAARLNPIKNISLLLRAFTLASKRNPQLRLKIAGIGEEEKKLKKLAWELGIEQITQFVGWVDDMPAFFADVDINVLSSLSETFPYSLLEGAYEHCAAIASNVGGIPELINHGETGYLFESNDEKSFAEYIYQLSLDNDLRGQLADNLFERAQAEFSLENMGRVQQAAYHVMIKQSQKTSRQGAVICGAYGRGNAGDEAILQAIIQQIKGIDEDMPINVMSRDKLNTKLMHKTNSLYIFNIPTFIRILRQTKIFINGGGSLIQDVTSSRSLYYYLFTLWAAKHRGCRVIMYGCGIGPIRHEYNQRFAAKVLEKNVEIITVRDSSSLDVLSQMKVTRPRIELSADPTVSIEKATKEQIDAAWQAEQVPSDIPKICVCLRKWADFDPAEVAIATNYAYEQYGLYPVFIPIELPADIGVIKKLVPDLRVPYYTCEKLHSTEELIGMLGSAKLVVGMRLHSLIFATLGGAPIIGISYDIKVNSFVRDIGSTACIPLLHLTAGRLIEQIDMIALDAFQRQPKAAERLRMGELINSTAVLELLKKAN